MNEDWLKEIHDKMAGYETDEPDGLWEGICEAMDGSRRRGAALWFQHAAAGMRQAARTPWVKRTAAVAAGVAIVFGSGYLLRRHIGEQEAVEQVELLAQAEVESSELFSVEDVEPMELLAQADIESKKLVEDRIQENFEEFVGETLDDEDLKDEKEVTTVVKTEETNISNVGKEQTAVTQPTEQQIIDGQVDFFGDNMFEEEASKKRLSRMSVGVFASGGSVSSSSAESMAQRTLFYDFADDETDNSSGEAEGKSRPMLTQSVPYAGDEDYGTTVKHHLPLKVGMTFAYRFNNQLSLETGLMYSRLSSDIQDGSGDNYTSADQILHYIGIPLSLNCRIYSWKNFEIYASAGGAAEKCVAGRLKTKYVLTDRESQTETEHLTVGPVQWSVNLTAGLSYNFTPLVSLYAEPGVTYYFDNGSSIRTSYTDKPWNFTLDLGLRFTFRR